jgi:hypothetical protein
MTTVPTEPPVAGDEFDTLIGSLERARRTLEWKCADLDAASMGTRIGRSDITLGGLVRHLTRVESVTFAWKLHDRDPGQPGEFEDPADDWNWTADDDPDATWAAWRAAVERSRALVAEAVADGGLARTKGHEFEGWGTPSLRRLLVDMIEEYARHVGHADLIRETIDGRTGEDPPG